MKNFFISLPFLLIVSLAVSLPLAKPGLYTVHDDQQIARLFLFDEAVKSGQFPVRWVDKLGFGFGYPLFVFYPPLVYMAGEMFHLIGFGFIDSIKLVFFTSIFASAIFMYVFSKELFGKLAALTSAMFYVFVPYRALDIYVRGALAESFSFVWLPAILWSFFKLYKTQKTSYTIISAIFLSFLMITHNLIFLPFMIILPFYLLFLLYKSQKRKDLFLNFVLAGIIGAGFSAFFWMPALIEKKYTIVDSLLVVNLASYKIHFVYPQQLWNWQWGFGGSAQGLSDGISFKIGKLHVISSILATILAVFILVKNKKSSKVIANNCQQIIFFFILFIFSALMATYLSKPIWDIVKPLSYLQFPWRFLTFTALFTSILAGSLVYLLKLPILRVLSVIFLALALIIPNFKLFKPQSYRTNLNDKIATSNEIIEWNVSRSSFEYAPKGVELYKSELGTNIIKIEKDEIPMQKIEIEDSNSQISNLKTSPTKVSFQTINQTPSVVKANIFNFPGWSVKVNGNSVKISDNNKFKLITFPVPKGESQVLIEFGNTKTRSVANMISLFTILFVISLIFYRKWPKHNTSLT